MVGDCLSRLEGRASKNVAGQYTLSNRIASATYPRAAMLPPQPPGLAAKLIAPRHPYRTLTSLGSHVGLASLSSSMSHRSLKASALLWKQTGVMVVLAYEHPFLSKRIHQYWYLAPCSKLSLGACSGCLLCLLVPSPLLDWVPWLLLFG
jgi:hypothetical protein